MESTTRLPSSSSMNATESAGAATVLGFTSDLLSALASSRAELDEFCSAAERRAVAAREANSDLVREKRDEVDSLLSRLGSVQAERGVTIGGGVGGTEAGTAPTGGGADASSSLSGNEGAGSGIAGRRVAMRERQAEMERETEEIRQREAVVRQEIDDVGKEERTYRLKAEEVRKAKLRVEEVKKTTLEDLTLGALNYNRLGINFERDSVDNRLRVVFTQLDPSTPLRPFTFSICVNDENDYEVAACDPTLEATAIVPLVDELNASSNDLQAFIHGMRIAFKRTLEPTSTDGVMEDTCEPI